MGCVCVRACVRALHACVRVLRACNPAPAPNSNPKASAAPATHPPLYLYPFPNALAACPLPTTFSPFSGGDRVNDPVACPQPQAPPRAGGRWNARSHPNPLPPRTMDSAIRWRIHWCLLQMGRSSRTEMVMRTMVRCASMHPPWAVQTPIATMASTAPPTHNQTVAVRTLTASNHAYATHARTCYAHTRAHAATCPPAPSPSSHYAVTLTPTKTIESHHRPPPREGGGTVSVCVREEVSERPRVGWAQGYLQGQRSGFVLTSAVFYCGGLPAVFIDSLVQNVDAAFLLLSHLSGGCHPRPFADIHLLFSTFIHPAQQQQASFGTGGPGERVHTQMSGSKKRGKKHRKMNSTSLLLLLRVGSCLFWHEV
jgi:hypothetical protein